MVITMQKQLISKIQFLDAHAGDIVRNVPYVPLFYTGFNLSGTLQSQMERYGRCYMTEDSFDLTPAVIRSHRFAKVMFQTLGTPEAGDMERPPVKDLAWRGCPPGFLPHVIRSCLCRSLYENKFMMMDGFVVEWDASRFAPLPKGMPLMRSIVKRTGKVIGTTEDSTSFDQDISACLAEAVSKGHSAYLAAMESHGNPYLPEFFRRTVIESFGKIGFHIQEEVNKADRDLLCLYMQEASRMKERLVLDDPLIQIGVGENGSRFALQTEPLDENYLIVSKAVMKKEGRLLVHIRYYTARREDERGDIRINEDPETPGDGIQPKTLIIRREASLVDYGDFCISFPP